MPNDRRNLKCQETIRTSRTRIHHTRPIRSIRRGPNRPAELSIRLGPMEPGEVDDMADLSLNAWETARLTPWWEREVTAMDSGYPSFTSIVRRRHRDPQRIIDTVALGRDCIAQEQPQTPREAVERDQCGEFVLAWKGTITPFREGMSLDGIQAIVADLDEDRRVRVMADGTLAHYEECGGTHVPRPEFRLERPLAGSFRIEIAYRRPPGCPIARSLEPRINWYHPSGHPPHLLNDIDALCVLFPADGAWVWPRDGAREYANFTAIWLAKHLVWVEARARGVGIEEAWPGSAVGHEPSEMPRFLGPKDPCRCGSGRGYGDCCAAQDREAAKEAAS